MKTMKGWKAGIAYPWDQGTRELCSYGVVGLLEGWGRDKPDLWGNLWSQVKKLPEMELYNCAS